MTAGELAALVHAIGGVVGGHGLQRADLQGPPQGLLVRRLAQGRRAHPHRTLEPRPVEVARGQGQVLGAGLAPDLVPLAAGTVDDAGTLGGADVEDHQGLVDQRGAGDGPADRLDLAEPRVRGHVIARRTVAAGEQALAHPADHAVILGMHADHQAVRARGVEHVQELPVLDAQPVVGQEHLERAMPRARQGRQLLGQDLGPRVAQDHMEGVVDHGSAPCGVVVVLDHLGQAGADMLRRERDHRRGAADRGRGGRGGEGVGVHQPGGGELLDVAVAVDAAGQDQPPGRVDLHRTCGELATDRSHLLARNPYVGVEDAGRGGDRAATDDQVELGHRRFRAAAARRTSRRGSSHLTSCGRK